MKSKTVVLLAESCFMWKLTGKTTTCVATDVSVVMPVLFLFISSVLLLRSETSTPASCPNKARMQVKEGLGNKACLIKTHSLVLSSASQMTSDQRTSLAIIIRL